MSLITLIAAVARKRAIGAGGRLPWHLPEDMAHFREMTRARPVIMGRKTWESLPEQFRPLPGRRNLVVSRNPEYRALGGETAPNLSAALEKTRDAAPFVIGGAEIYTLALPYADRLELTEIDLAIPDADAWFPDFSPREWREIRRLPRVSATGISFAFVTYERRVPVQTDIPPSRPEALPESAF